MKNPQNKEIRKNPEAAPITNRMVPAKPYLLALFMLIILFGPGVKEDTNTYIKKPAENISSHLIDMI
ncbi:hypothetical protein D3C75_1096250 [compost metagenome]